MSGFISLLFGIKLQLLCKGKIKRERRVEKRQLKYNMAFTMHKSSGHVDVVFRNPSASYNPEIDNEPEMTTVNVKKSRLKWVILCVSIILLLSLSAQEKSKCTILTYLYLMPRGIAIAEDGRGNKFVELVAFIYIDTQK